MGHNESSAKRKVHSTECLHKEHSEGTEYLKTLELKEANSSEGLDSRKYSN